MPDEVLSLFKVETWVETFSHHNLGHDALFRTSDGNRILYRSQEAAIAAIESFFRSEIEKWKTDRWFGRNADIKSARNDPDLPKEIRGLMHKHNSVRRTKVRSTEIVVNEKGNAVTLSVAFDFQVGERRSVVKTVDVDGETYTRETTETTWSDWFPLRKRCKEQYSFLGSGGCVYEDACQKITYYVNPVTVVVRGDEEGGK